MKSLDASEALDAACRKHAVALCRLIAETTLWANPEVCRELIRIGGNPCYFPNTRRCRKGQGERRNQVIDGIRLDDNTYANHAIKQSLGVGRNAKGYEVCHIWSGSSYSERCHTAIPNLVLIPRPLAGLSDHDKQIQAALQFRSFELYQWLPPNTEIPIKPENYPDCWQTPLAFSSEIANSIRKRKAK